MKLWLLERTDRVDYDEYDSCVVVAASEDEARQIHPRGVGEKDQGVFGGWTKPERLTVSELGTALDPTPRVVCASFNAG